MNAEIAPVCVTCGQPFIPVQRGETDALAGEVWQEADNVLLLCVIPNRVWQDFNGQRFEWDAPTVARPLRRLLDRAGNLAPERTYSPGQER